jgi:hypothetical protein
VRDQDDNRRRFTLPLRRFVLQPITALVVAVVHVYLAAVSRRYQRVQAVTPRMVGKVVGNEGTGTVPPNLGQSV